MGSKADRIPAGEFKQKCLAILDDVANTHREVIVTKRGVPVARVVPLESDREIEERVLKLLRSGVGGMLVDEDTFLQPTSGIAEWSES